MDEYESWTRYPSLAKDLPRDAAIKLEQYCLLGRVGHFQAAEDTWTKYLKQHASSYLYSISYLDIVLRQSRYGTAIDYLTEYQNRFFNSDEVIILPVQRKVLSVMQAYLNIFTRGWLRAAVFQVRELLNLLSGTKADDYNDYDVRAFSP